MDSHLVAVKVGVESGTYQRMKLDCLALDQDRLECLDAQSVQGRCTVEHNRMLFDDIFKNIPDSGIDLFDQLLCILDVLGDAPLLQFLHDEGLEKFQSHFLGNTALVDLHLRTDNDNGTAGIVDTFAQKVLSETAALALEHVGQGLECAVAGAGDRTASAAVVDQGIHCFLQHSLLVPDDDIRSAQLQKSLQAVVSVDDPSVQVIQVGGGKTAAVQLDHGTQIRRNDRNAVHDHPGRRVFGLSEGLDDLQSLDNTGSLLAGCCFHGLGKLLIFGFYIYGEKQFLDSLGTHTGTESASGPLVSGFLILSLRQDLLVFQIGRTGIQNDIGSKVKYFFQYLGGKVKDQAHTAGDPLEIPDMRYGRSQLDMSHSLASDGGLGDFDAASVADDAFISDLFVLSAVALPVLGGAEDLFTEQAVLFGL